MAVNRVILWMSASAQEQIQEFQRELDEMVELLTDKHGCSKVRLSINPLVRPFAMESLAGDFFPHFIGREDLLGMAALPPVEPVLHMLVGVGEHGRMCVIRAVRWLKAQRPRDSFCAILVEGEGSATQFRPLVAASISEIIGRMERREAEIKAAAEEEAGKIIDASGSIQPGETWAKGIETLQVELPAEGEELEEADSSRVLETL